MRYVIEIRETDDEWQVRPVEHEAEEVSLERKQAVVGGLVDVVSVAVEGVDNEVDVWINDEGLLMSMPLNPGATILTGRSLVGDAIVTRHDGKGGSVSMTREEVEAVINHMKSRSIP